MMAMNVKDVRAVVNVFCLKRQTTACPKQWKQLRSLLRKHERHIRWRSSFDVATDEKINNFTQICRFSDQ